LDKQDFASDIMAMLGDSGGSAVRSRTGDAAAAGAADNAYIKILLKLSRI
jgi:hypothetical protein